MLDRLQEAIAAGRRAIDQLEAQLAELTSGQHRYIVGGQGRYDLTHGTLLPYATALLALDGERAAKGVARAQGSGSDSDSEVHDADVHDSKTPAELLQLLRSTAAAHEVEWGAQGYFDDDFGSVVT